MIPSLDFGSFSFAAPLVLLGLAVLPVVLFLLRLIPPSPRRQSFPPLRLLQGLQDRAQHAARTPLWVLVLRMAALSLVLLGLAQPLILPPQSRLEQGALLLVIDDGWSAASDWDRRQSKALALLDQAATAQRPTAILTTAPPADGGPIEVSAFTAASDARRAVQALTPKPWASDWQAVNNALEALESQERPTPLQVIWFSDALATPAEAIDALAARLQRWGSLTVVPPGQAASSVPFSLASPLVLLPPARQAGGLSVQVRWPAAAAEGTRTTAETAPSVGPMVVVRASDDQGRTVASAVLRAESQTVAGVLLPLPADALRTVTRLDVVYPDGRRGGAGGVQILDNRWRQSPVGLARWEDGGDGIPLLAAETYLRTALTPAHDIRSGSLQDLLTQPIGTLLLPDSPAAAALGGPQAQALSAWVDQGGLLIRFAGPHLAAAPSSRLGTAALLPVSLRQGGRTLGGILSWTEPARLAAFAPQSPFAGLVVPPGVDVSAQVLADPSSLAAAEVWARLTDGTPLVSAARQGQGWLVLVHTSADPSWSNLPLSGLFPQLLDRLIALAPGSHASTAAPAPLAASGANTGARHDGANVLPPLRTLDGFGAWQAPPVTVKALSLRQGDLLPPSPAHPPGLYGRMGVNQGGRVAVNVASAETTLTAFSDWPSGVLLRDRPQDSAPFDLRPGLLLAAMVLLWGDGVVSLWLRGLLAGGPRGVRRRKGPESSSALTVLIAVVGLAAGAIMMPGSMARAQSVEAALAMLDGRLAYVLTGDSTVDSLSQSALEELTAVLRNRTSIELGSPQGVNPAVDDLTFFPLLYWPVQSPAPQLDAPTRLRLETYRAHGGVIVFDAAARNDGGPNTDALRDTLRAVGISRLQPLPADHLLTRTFYLTSGLPGRLPEGQVWIEPQAIAAPGSSEQAVSTVIAGTTDWAGAWAADIRGRFALPLLGGGTRGREMAYRGGVNMVVYALTGTYKSDQVHVPAILERLDGPAPLSPLPLLPPSLLEAPQ